MFYLAMAVVDDPPWQYPLRLASSPDEAEELLPDWLAAACESDAPCPDRVDVLRCGDGLPKLVETLTI